MYEREQGLVNTVVRATLIGIFMLLVVGIAIFTTPKQTSPSIYIISSDDYQSVDGKPMYSLSYSLNGQVETADFPTDDARGKYADYLKLIGRVEE
jgi:hypothetical protein